MTLPTQIVRNHDTKEFGLICFFNTFLTNDKSLFMRTRCMNKDMPAHSATAPRPRAGELADH